MNRIKDLFNTKYSILPKNIRCPDCKCLMVRWTCKRSFNIDKTTYFKCVKCRFKIHFFYENYINTIIFNKFSKKYLFVLKIKDHTYDCVYYLNDNDNDNDKILLVLSNIEKNHEMMFDATKSVDSQFKKLDIYATFQ